MQKLKAKAQRHIVAEAAGPEGYVEAADQMNAGAMPKAPTAETAGQRKKRPEAAVEAKASPPFNVKRAAARRGSQGPTGPEGRMLWKAGRGRRAWG